jgi:nitroreductase
VKEAGMLDLLTLMQERRSQRGPYDQQRRIEREALEKIIEAGRWAPTAHNMQNFEIIVVDDRQKLEAVAGIGFSLSEIFVRENYKQLSFSEEELAKKKVGILGTMFPPVMRKPDFRLSDLTEEEKKGMATRIPLQASAALLVVLYDPRQRAPASEGDFLGIMSLGCVMENMWLMANSMGIGLHILSSLAADPVESKLKRLLDIPENLKVAFTCRLGYPPQKPDTYLRVRRDIQDLTHHNRFGNKGLG